MKYGMVIDLKKCVGCKACTVACKQYHGAPGEILFNRVLDYEVGSYPLAGMRFLPLQCMHCEDPPCVKVCPTKAASKNDHGLVETDSRACAGCRACLVACPYGVRSYIQDFAPYYSHKGKTPFETLKHKKYTRGTVVKCVFCADRLEQGREPACVQTCPASARVFGDLDDSSSEVSKLIVLKGALPYRAEFGTKPQVYYIF